MGPSYHTGDPAGLSSRDEAVVEGVADELRARSEAQLLLNVRAMSLHGAHGQIELFGDLGVGVAQDDELSELPYGGV